MSPKLVRGIMTKDVVEYIPEEDLTNLMLREGEEVVILAVILSDEYLSGKAYVALSLDSLESATVDSGLVGVSEDFYDVPIHVFFEE